MNVLFKSVAWDFGFTLKHGLLLLLCHLLDPFCDCQNVLSEVVYACSIFSPCRSSRNGEISAGSWCRPGTQNR